MPREKVEKIREKMEKGRLRLTGDFNDLFFLWRPSRAASCSAAGAPPEGVDKRKREKRGLSACRRIPRDSLTGITPVRKYLRGVSAVIG